MDAPLVQYIRTSDGYDIAYAVSGTGVPFVMLPTRFNHLEANWSQQDSSFWPWLDELSQRFCLVRFDGRGQGMSSRGLPEQVDLADLSLDLEAVVDRMELKGFILYGYGWSAHTAIRYATSHPERVRALILTACSIDGLAWPGAMYESLATQDWEVFLRSQAGLGEAKDVSASRERLRASINQHDYRVLVTAFSRSNISELLPLVRCPSLVIHARNFFLLRPEESMKAAAALPNGRFLLTEGASPFGDPAQGLKAINELHANLPGGLEGAYQHGRISPVAPGRSVVLTSRQQEVLALLAAGKTNREIAEDLVLSERTIERHVSDIYAKIGTANRAQAATFAAHHGMV